MDHKTRALLWSLSSVITAATSSACAGRSVDEGSSETDGMGESGASSATTDTAGSQSGSASEGTASEGTAPSTGDGDGDGDGGSEASDSSDIKLDVPEDNTSGSTGSTGSTGGEGCGPFIPDPWSLDWQIPPSCEDAPFPWAHAPVCFYPPEGTSCDDQPYADACILNAYVCGLSEGGEGIGCGPFTTPEGACCYGVYGECAIGRPFLIAGEARLAALVSGSRWHAAPRPKLDGLDPATRAALADAWTRYGLSEHASIASFARFGTQLLALGAPARLVAASLAAGRDERRHALLSFGLATAYADAPHDPAALATGGCHEARSPAQIVRALASEGCVGETVSLMLLDAARHDARDPAVKACLEQVVADERRHVLLAWGALAWMCARYGEPARRAAREVFADARAHVGFGARTQLRGDPERMREHGYLDLEQRRALAERALAELVAPAAALISATSAPHSALV